MEEAACNHHPQAVVAAEACSRLRAGVGAVAAACTRHSAAEEVAAEGVRCPRWAVVAAVAGRTSLSPSMWLRAAPARLNRARNS